MIRNLLLGVVIVGFVADIALGQSNVGPAGVSSAQMNDAIATASANLQSSILAVMPTPFTSVPLGPSAGGVAGSGLFYVPGNAAQRQSVQKFRAQTLSDGTWSVTWSTPFQSSAPIVSTNPLNPNGATNGPVVCNVFTAVAATATGRCWQNGSLLTVLGLTVLGAPITPATGMTIMVTGSEPTQ